MAGCCGYQCDVESRDHEQMDQSETLKAVPGVGVESLRVTAETRVKEPGREGLKAITLPEEPIHVSEYRLGEDAHDGSSLGEALQLPR
jgi:hypothetical protein